MKKFLTAACLFSLALPACSKIENAPGGTPFHLGNRQLNASFSNALSDGFMEKYFTLAQEIEKELSAENENESFPATAEITDYYGRWRVLAANIGLLSSDSMNYHSDNIHLYYDEYGEAVTFMNHGDASLSAFGIKIGDSCDSAVNALKETLTLLECQYGGGQVRDLYIWDGYGSFDVVYLSLKTDASGNVSQWTFINWPEGENASYYIEAVKAMEENGVQEAKEWQEQYIHYVFNDYIESYNVDHEYQLAYINDDDIPEVIIYYGPFGSSKILSFTGNTVMEQYAGKNGLRYLERGNLFIDSGGRASSFYDDVYKIENGQFVLAGSGIYGAQDILNVQYDDLGNAVYEYQWNGNPVSEDQYSRLLEEAFPSETAVTPYNTEEIYSLYQLPEAIFAIK